MSNSSNVFDLFISKENIKIIKDSISITIQNEYQQKIGNRYDDLIENKMNELMKKVDNKVPDGKSKGEYILMMNKKLISTFLLPTIRANAIKEKSRSQTQMQGQSQKRVYDDPQDLLKQNKVRDDQFNLPLEDISQRFVPDYPRPNNKSDLQLKRMENERNIYQSFSNGMPQNLPKFQDDLPEKRHDETLAMFNQLKSAYDEEKIKNGDELSTNQHPKSNQQNNVNQISFEEPYYNNTFQKKKVILRKNKFETPIEELNKIDDNTNVVGDNKIKELLTTPQIHQPFLYTEKDKKKNNISIHFSSNHRNFEYHKSSSSIRIYLTPYFDYHEDNFVYFSIPSYTDKHGNMIYNDFISKHNMDHHIQIPNLKNLKSIQINKIKLNQSIQENKLKVEILPRISNNNDNKINHFYHNYSNEKMDLFLYDKNNDIYINSNDNVTGQNIHVDIQSVIKNNYIQMNIYDIYGQKLFYEKDILHIHKIDVDASEEGGKNIFLYYKYQHNNIKSMINQLKRENNKIYIYSLLPDENKNDYVELSDSVLLESVDKIVDNKFKLSALYIIDNENHYKVNFKELFEKCKKDLEDDTHKDISDLFYFVIKQQGKNGPILYYCNIDHVDELGNIILIHKECEHIVENYENTEQFGFIKKNFNGCQNNDINSLFRPQGFHLNDIEEKDNMIVFKIPIHNDSYEYNINLESLNENEAFIRFDKYEIDLFFDLTFT